MRNFLLKSIVPILLYLYYVPVILAENSGLSIKGKVTEINGLTPIPYANIYLPHIDKGTQTNEKGEFYIDKLKPGFYQIRVSCIGYESYLSHQFQLSTNDYTLSISLEKDNVVLNDVLISAPTFRKNPEAPLSLQIISLQEIEKIPGANRDISKVISSFAGVASTSIGYRNDLFVRGGGPSENKFYLDGIEIPNINHFATQGASGGPVGILNADLLREVEFFSGGFPANRENGISSVLDFKLKDGSSERNTFKFTLGASEAGISSNGPLGDKTTYQLSVRYSYLQFLFSVLKLPFLPRYVDSQFKIKTRFNAKNELTVLGIGALDNMKLNNDVNPEEEDRYQLYQVLPEYKQKTYTVGAIYKYYADRHTRSISLSNSFLRNGALKYNNNDFGNNEALRLNYKSDEVQTRIRLEQNSYYNQIRINGGISAEYASYTNNTFQKKFQNESLDFIQYHASFGFWKYAAFASISWKTIDNRFNCSYGMRIDGNSYSDKMKNPFHQFAPRMSASYNFYGPWLINANAGRYYQLPMYTSMGYKNNNGDLVNKNTARYYLSDQIAAGIEFRPSQSLRINGEYFYKWFKHGPLSLLDSIPVSSQGSDFGVIGDEAILCTSRGKAYGVEVSAKWILQQRLTFLGSYTFVRSWVIDERTDKYVPSSWDNKHLFTGTLLYSFRRNWEVGLKLRYMGGMPYTPIDTEASSLVNSWNTTHESVLDYTKFNQKRMGEFAQVDIRIEKSFYWKHFMVDLYLDIQNILNYKTSGPPDYISTGIIENPQAPVAEQRYIMKWIKNESGNILPTVGLIFEF